jgi:hypothetical protein
VYTKKQALEMVIDQECDGVREVDLERLRRTAVDTGETVTYKVIAEQAINEFEHGWLFHRRSGGFDKKGEPVRFIGSRSGIFFNRRNGKIQYSGSRALWPFNVENFKRTGNIRKGCCKYTLHFFRSEIEGIEASEQSFIAEAKAHLLKLLETHTELSGAAAFVFSNSLFGPKEDESLFTDAKSKKDAQRLSAATEFFQLDLPEKHDCYGIEIIITSYAEAKSESR